MTASQTALQNAADSALRLTEAKKLTLADFRAVYAVLDEVADRGISQTAIGSVAEFFKSQGWQVQPKGVGWEISQA